MAEYRVLVVCILHMDNEIGKAVLGRVTLVTGYQSDLQLLQ